MTDEHKPQPLAAPRKTAASWNLVPTNLGEAMKFAQIMSESGMVPEVYQRQPGNILVAVQMGATLGLDPMQALQNIAVVNGRPCVWGDALPALAKRHPKYEWMKETYDEAARVATCTMKRQGEPEYTQTFSWKDAELAGLAKKDTYVKYPKRMLPIRARAWCIRNVFPDALLGLAVAEEMMDLDPAKVEVAFDSERPAPTPTKGMAGLGAAVERVVATQRQEENAAQTGAGEAEAVKTGEVVDEQTGEIVDLAQDEGDPSKPVGDNPVEPGAIDVGFYRKRMEAAKDIDELEVVGKELLGMPPGDERKALRKEYRKAFDDMIHRQMNPNAQGSN